MEPIFIHLPEKKLVGVGAKFISILSPDKNNMNVIPNLWHQFMSRSGTIPNKVGQVSYGLVECLPEAAGGKSHKDELFYVACTEVSEISSIPSGMIHRTIPAGRYAKFTHMGKLEGLGNTMNFIYKAWLPKSGVELRDGPHIEWYDNRFNLRSDQSEFDILLPVH
jgi:AraC family transcriptional regulator